jgi:hypothetical protein
MFGHLRAAWRDYWPRRTEAMRAARDARPVSSGRKSRWRTWLDRWRARRAAADEAMDPPPEPTRQRRSKPERPVETVDRDDEYTAEDDEPEPPKLVLLDGGKADDPPAKPEQNPQRTDRANKPEPVASTEPQSTTTAEPDHQPRENTSVDTEAAGPAAIRAALIQATDRINGRGEGLGRDAITLHEAADGYEGRKVNGETVACMHAAADHARMAAASAAAATEQVRAALAAFNRIDGNVAEAADNAGNLADRSVLVES